MDSVQPLVKEEQIGHTVSQYILQFFNRSSEYTYVRKQQFARFYPSWAVNILPLFFKKLVEENTEYCKFPVTADTNVL